MDIGISRPEAVRRMLANTNRAGDCHVWLGSFSGVRCRKAPQPRICLNYRSFIASRVAYQLWVGDVPAKAQVLHRCDRPECVNPKHLFLGTNADNMADKVAKGRQYRGQGHHLATLSDEKVRDIRRELQTGLMRGTELARKYGVTPSSVSQIKKAMTRIGAMGDDAKPLPGRPNKGETHFGAKLSDADVLAVRLQVASGISQSSVARGFVVSQSTISRLVRGERRVLDCPR